MSETTNRLGVHFVGTACLKNGWLFREQLISDQGIDGHAEKAIGDIGTGRLLAVQIKTGGSWFRRPTDSGWTFPFNSKKAKLWLGHALPVVVVLVNLDEDVAYWQHISTRTVTSTGKGFKVEVPRSQVLAQADVEWTHIASGLESRARDRYDLALTQLPPSVRRILDSRPANDHLDVAVLALHLAEGRHNPRGTTQSLVAASPGWIERQQAHGWQAIACYAVEHDVLDLAADAFERAAAMATDRPGRFLAAAGLNLMHLDRRRSEDLLRRADATGDAPLLIAIARAQLGHPEGDAGPRNLDPILLGDGEVVRGSQPAQGLLSDQAIRSGNVDAACAHARLALDIDTEDTAAMEALASTLIKRSSSSQEHPDDLSTAIGLLERAVDQRHRWAGPTMEILDSLLRAYVLSGQFEAMLSRCLPSPQGTASSEEAEHPHIRRSALFAANAAGRKELVDDLATRLGDSSQDQIARLRAGLLRLAPDEQIALWAAELSRATTDNDYEAIAKSVIALASLGRDERQSLAQLVERLMISDDYLKLATALITAKHDLNAALPIFRSLARHDMIAAEYLIDKLAAAGRHTEAAQECKTLYAHSGKPYFLIGRAQGLIDGEHHDEAETVAAVAVNSTAEFPTKRGNLLAYLASRAAGRDEWEIAERHLTAALRLRGHASPAVVWRLVFTQIKQGKLKRAAQTIAEHKPHVTQRDEAMLWLQANATIAWDETKASEAFALAQRFHDDDPHLAAAMLGHIVATTHGVDTTSGAAASEYDPLDDADLEQRRRIALRPVSADLHRQAFDALHQLATKFGERSGIKIVQGEPEDVVAQMATMSQETAATTAAFKDVVSAARDGTLPRGLVATMTGKSLTTLLVQRAFGPLVSSAANDDEHDLDISSAVNSLGQPVVVDTATLLVLTGMASSSHLEGQFSLLQVPVRVMWDIHRGVIDARSLAGSPGTLAWDSQSQALTFWQLDEAEFIRWLRRAQALEDFVQNLTVRPVRELALFADLGTRLGQSPWLDPIQLAHDQQVALWSDDLGLRRLARHKGVPCFGTPALIDALRDRALERASTSDTQETVLMQAAADNRQLAQDMVVDVALHLEDLFQIAQHDNWEPHAAALVVSRPSWWAWQATPTTDAITFLGHIQANNPDSFPHWQHAVMFGAGRAFQPPILASKILAALALLGHGAEAKADEATAAAHRARQVADELGLPDPVTQLPAAATALAISGRCPNPQEIVTAILAQLGQRDGTSPE